MPKSVAIVAFGPSMHKFVEIAKAIGGRHVLADEVWGINAIASVLNCDRAFHMDDVRIQEIRAEAQPDSNIAHMLTWLKTAKGPIYTSRAHPGYPGLVDFPLADVLNATGGMPYFNSTPAYALALAIAEGFEEINLFGLDYTYANAHDAEKGRACIEFWVGRAMALGAHVVVPDTSSLLDSCVGGHSLYGYGRFGSLDVSLELVDGKVAVAFAERPALPTAEEIEREYDHARHPSPLASGVTQPKD
jgi:hypothetical protein